MFLPSWKWLGSLSYRLTGRVGNRGRWKNVMTESSIRAILADRLRQVDGRLRAACQRAGRPRDAVKLMAVTKTVGIEVARLLPALGVCDLGENRPQELWRKAEALPDSIR